MKYMTGTMYHAMLGDIKNHHEVTSKYLHENISFSLSLSAHFRKALMQHNLPIPHAFYKVNKAHLLYYTQPL